MLYSITIWTKKQAFNCKKKMFFQRLEKTSFSRFCIKILQYEEKTLYSLILEIKKG